jgi:hypothetical protein
MTILTPVHVRAYSDLGARPKEFMCNVRHSNYKQLLEQIRLTFFPSVRRAFHALNEPVFLSIRPPENVLAGGFPPVNFLKESSKYKPFYDYLARHPDAGDDERTLQVELYIEPDMTEGLTYVRNVHKALALS